ncbi:hypothetical protein [Gloeobacter morelensis]|uniref:Uncharacterized protein n=1 Tax=Gloeobacter morelensis MG652769 TaxID=2781736 RepID=A0ABY3PPZ3_9CYAN|nr:hypothetical protein [Gloeobacter morelensis]UFP95761.1 hypothetical protein ISF26_05885 [Gloeobacter morelensis MG652769]
MPSMLPLHKPSKSLLIAAGWLLVFAIRAGAQTLDSTADTELSEPPTASPPALQLGIEKVIPEWVRGTWRYTSIIVEEKGFRNLGRYRKEELALPGDLSPRYYTHYDDGEKLERVCWQVTRHTSDRFAFTERLKDSRGALLEDVVEITSVKPGQAAIRQRTVVLKAAGWTGKKRTGGLFEHAPGTSGAYHVRTGVMQRDPGSQGERLQEVDLDRLRCR